MEPSGKKTKLKTTQTTITKFFNQTQYRKVNPFNISKTPFDLCYMTMEDYNSGDNNVLKYCQTSCDTFKDLKRHTQNRKNPNKSTIEIIINMSSSKEYD